MKSAAAIVIEKRIPLPLHAGRAGRPAIYPFRQLKVGQSFLFPRKVDIKRAASAAWAAGQSLDARFTCRTTTDGVRCWRMS